MKRIHVRCKQCTTQLRISIAMDILVVLKHQYLAKLVYIALVAVHVSNLNQCIQMEQFFVMVFIVAQ